MSLLPHELDRKIIVLWLTLICGLVMGAVIVGGATRLTNSGLSITEWAPIMGAIPPLTENEWQNAFEKYKTIPEYSIEHPTMDVEGFKFIFYWEYAHRNIGRLLGLVFILPFLFFLMKGRLSRALIGRLLVGFTLGGLQGAMGWFMVTSGLSERTDVSHYRLAAHLILAFLIFAYFLRLILDLTWGQHYKKSKRFASLIVKTYILQILIGLQIVYGAFVAGLRAGHIYNTFPTMNGEWLPAQVFLLSPTWLNLFENSASVQFIHRWLGILIVGLTIIFYRTAKRSSLNCGHQRIVNAFAVSVGVQVSLGIVTLVYQMPFFSALTHQAMALIVFGLLQILTYGLRRPEKIVSDAATNVGSSGRILP